MLLHIITCICSCTNHDTVYLLDVNIRDWWSTTWIMTYLVLENRLTGWRLLKVVGTMEQRFRTLNPWFGRVDAKERCKLQNLQGFHCIAGHAPPTPQGSSRKQQELYHGTYFQSDQCTPRRLSRIAHNNLESLAEILKSCEYVWWDLMTVMVHTTSFCESKISEIVTLAFLKLDHPALEHIWTPKTSLKKIMRGG